MSGIHDELKRWTVGADEREMVLNTASETLADFEGVERAVVALQESLAKVRLGRRWVPNLDAQNGVGT